ncbi:uncharacterized protein [Macrobrachium rosenbergii]|uniref:uncharacterized protein n=1 Tax=Macrobrachium rosenbergii TaxID=79674 RepID=UPI0034D683C7
MATFPRIYVVCHENGGSTQSLILGICKPSGHSWCTELVTLNINWLGILRYILKMCCRSLAQYYYKDVHNSIELGIFQASIILVQSVDCKEQRGGCRRNSHEKLQHEA